ncbi:phage tail tip lysozyme [Nocardia sp. NPDC050793]|uniref:phage tail tip lysozyme n=1 Tax=Nocardia sp. NPDC050793 TaxID=3155159 RepID=UPI0033CD20EE
MATAISLHRVLDAPLLNEFVTHTESILRDLLDKVGNGSAETVTLKSLSGMGLQQLATSEMETAYKANKEQVGKYQEHLNTLDIQIADIAAKSARIANLARNEVERSANAIDGRLRIVTAHPTNDEQLATMSDVCDIVDKAAMAVSDAQEKLLSAASGVPIPSTQGGGYTPAPTYPVSSSPLSSPWSSSRTGGVGSPNARAGSYGKPRQITAGQQVQVKEIYDYLTTKYGFTPAQAAGILGNMQAESDFKTDAYNEGEGAIGLCQWEGGRRDRLEAFAAAQGKPVTDWRVQVDFMMHEMQGSESVAFQKIKSTHSPAAAAEAFDQFYERSSGDARSQRMSNANNIASLMTGVSV